MIPISKPYIGDKEKKAVLEVLESGMLVQGPRTAELEERFSAICTTGYAVATSSGTTALQVALLANGIGPGDEVITTPFSFIATVNCILYVGARPVFVDIEEETFNINPALIEEAITANTKAILPVHLYGYPCNMDAIMAIAKRHSLAVIEDAAQAIGAEYKGRRTGSFGTGCFSLYATKNIMSGEGGIITTNDASVAARCRMIRNHGMRERYHYEMLGYNFRMSDLHAVIGLAQCGRLDGFTEHRRENASYLSSHLTGVITPKVSQGYKHVWHQYTVRVRNGQDRNQVAEQLRRSGIGTGIFYPLPLNRQPYLAKFGLKKSEMPAAERMAKEVLSLPVHPQLSRSDLDTIVVEVNKL